MRARSAGIFGILLGLLVSSAPVMEVSADGRTWSGFNPLRLTTLTILREPSTRPLLSAGECVTLRFHVSRDGHVHSVDRADSTGADSFSADSLWSVICDSVTFDEPEPWTAPSDQLMVIAEACLDLSGSFYRLNAPQATGVPPDRRLLTATLTANGRALPKLKSFPSFYPAAGRPDSLPALPLVLLRLKPGDHGSVSAAELLRTSADNLGGQLSSAALRGKFEADGKSRSSTEPIYLLINALTSGQSPLPTLTNDTTSEWFGLPRLIVLPGEPRPEDMLIPPLPRSDCRQLSWPELEKNNAFSSLSLRCLIDSTGHATFFPDRGLSGQLRAPLLRMMTTLHYFPAYRGDFRPVEWRGSVTVKKREDSGISVTPNWLYR